MCIPLMGEDVAGHIGSLSQNDLGRYRLSSLGTELLRDVSCQNQRPIRL
jgi:hypothetical protein